MVRLKIGRIGHRCQLVRVKIGRLGQRGDEGILSDEVTTEVDQPDDPVMHQSLDDITLL